ncbi:bifunctional adenosylcobinamide kinase/adenosylcobinamide-phosphate guanylyltransferase [Calidifontibacillus erzurumensis]|uniref:bifunctional adenosylcobinamide kinase/adenosylcobinamide-phosphate guanylyltransferase n=1 Tax=Calidifontibacillus erzurumensis TaxID=2741433 RepID=UPI002E779699|nr:bifunctional adenosylcobinamide kinase/adenosylcobinamide-phosphate guanylyltransferase [Calidifontibacillus erzurumensis]
MQLLPDGHHLFESKNSSSKLIFISGGVRSGKSTFAEKLACSIAGKTSSLHYIATSLPYDDEMVARIKKHQLDRSEGIYKWKTWEQPMNLHYLVNQFTNRDVVLIDCLTTLLGNELFFDGCWLDEKKVEAMLNRLKNTFELYKQTAKTTIIVSNEIFSEGIPTDRGSRLYMKQLGKLHQFLITLCNEAYLLEYGVVRKMKEGH